MQQQQQQAVASSQIKQVCPINPDETQSSTDFPFPVTRKRRSKRSNMWLLVCEEQEQEMGRQRASGSCPYCDGKVEAVDVESRCSFCFLPMCFNVKRKYLCTMCGRRLVLLFQ